MTTKENRMAFGIACVLAMRMALAQVPEVGPQDAAKPLPPGLTRATRANPAAENNPPTGTVAAPKAMNRPVGTAAAAPKAANMPAGTRTIAPTTVAKEKDAEETEAEGEKTKTTTPSLKFDNAPTDLVLQAYAQETGKTLLMAPDVPKANITLKSQAEVPLSKEEYIEAIEMVLGMNGIVLEPFGKKFVKVLARKTLRTEGVKILMEPPEEGHPEKGKMISQMIVFKHIAATEAQKALEGFKKPEGLFQTFERTNSILITDIQENINRMLEIVKFIDQPLLVTEEVNVRVIRFAKAEDIKKRLEELVAESQKQQQAKEEIKANASGSPGITRSTSSPAFSSLTGRSLPPGLVRPGGSSTPVPVTPNESLSAMVSDADRGMIRGKVQIIADERSNKLIIITRPENMQFFDKIIEVLDIETAPDVRVKIIRLQHATVEGKEGEKGMVEILNELIGNASASKSTGQKSSKTDSKSKSSTYGGPGGNQNLTSTPAPTPAPTPAAQPAVAAAGNAVKGKVGELSKENITILSDKRINALIIMSSPGDLAVIESIIAELDVELAQVLIETVLLEVLLDDQIKTGIDWVQSSVKGNRDVKYMGSGGAGANKDLLSQLGTVATKTGSSGINYWFALDKLNLDMVVSAFKSDSRTKVLQSPVLMTVDNKEATLEATEMRYLYKGVRYAGSYNYGTEVPDYEQRDFGLTIKVTPRINPNGNVMMIIDEKFETLGTPQSIPGAGGSSTNSSGTAAGEFPTINTRKLQAEVSVGNGQTIILGGLTKRDSTQVDTGIPILKDIPFIGRYLFGSTSEKEVRTELMVFLTPYVLKGSDEAQAEARRRKASIDMEDVWTKGWSRSELADPQSKREVLRQEQRRMQYEKQQRDADAALRKLKEKAQKEALKDPDAARAEPNRPEGSTPPAFGVLQVTEEKSQVIQPPAAPVPAK